MAAAVRATCLDCWTPMSTARRRATGYTFSRCPIRDRLGAVLLRTADLRYQYWLAFFLLVFPRFTFSAATQRVASVYILGDGKCRDRPTRGSRSPLGWDSGYLAGRSDAVGASGGVTKPLFAQGQQTSARSPPGQRP